MGRPNLASSKPLSSWPSGLFPASVIAALPILTLGLALLPFRATRGSGITLSAYAGAYLVGLAAGAGLTWLTRP